MIHDPELIDKLAGFPTETFDGRVFRASGISRDPTASSTSGGRWSPVDVSVLYTSFERDGALAEVVSYLSLLTPLPNKPLRVHEIQTSTSKTLRLARTTLTELGVDMTHYGTRDYAVTQQIGAAVNFLELDGLITPSARWACDNLTIFSENHSLDKALDVLNHDDVDWQAWAKDNGFL
ncbi:MAG: RES family NAD+ phosphorylase [Pseudomonadota bacterium]